MSPSKWPKGVCMLCEGRLARGEKTLCQACIDEPTSDRRGINRPPTDKRLTASRTLNLSFDSSYRDNPHILRWWTVEHDAALRRLIEEKGPAWPWHATDRIVAMTSAQTIDQWRQDDPICAQFAWYNVLMYFAGSRARGLDPVGVVSQAAGIDWSS